MLSFFFFLIFLKDLLLLLLWAMLKSFIEFVTIFCFLKDFIHLLLAALVFVAALGLFIARLLLLQSTGSRAWAQ